MDWKRRVRPRFGFAFQRFVAVKSSPSLEADDDDDDDELVAPPTFFLKSYISILRRVPSAFIGAHLLQ